MYHDAESQSAIRIKVEFPTFVNVCWMNFPTVKMHTKLQDILFPQAA